MPARAVLVGLAVAVVVHLSLAPGCTPERRSSQSAGIMWPSPSMSPLVPSTEGTTLR